MTRLGLLAAALVAVAETYRRGYMAPLAYGARCWMRARPDRYYQPDVIA